MISVAKGRPTDLQSEVASHFSIYEVFEVNPEVGLKLKDFFMGESLDIVEGSGTRTLTKWDIIFGRVNKMGPIHLTCAKLGVNSRRKPGKRRGLILPSRTENRSIIS